MNISTKETSSEITEFAARLIRLMPRFLRGIMTQERNYLVRGLITLPQLWVLQHVSERQICAMRDLARDLALKSSTLTGLADRLVDLGLLRRFNSRTDRRLVLTAITPKGHKILAHLNDERRKSTIRLFQQISANERAIFLNIIERVAKTENVGSHAPDNPQQNPKDHAKKIL